jgi:hypothetical protein
MSNFFDLLLPNPHALRMESKAREPLSEKFVQHLTKLGSSLANGNEFNALVPLIITELNTLPPKNLPKLDWKIAEYAQLYPWRETGYRWFQHFKATTRDVNQLQKYEGLEYLFIFHRDGFVREAALKKINGPIPSPFIFSAITLRLNDWVPEVRNAAAYCVVRTFPKTNPDFIAKAAIYLLVRSNNWKRWSDEKEHFFNELFRSDVAESLVELFCSETTGPMASALRFAMRKDLMDKHLSRILDQAIQPQIRAIAGKAMIEGQASWPIGFEWRWINKPMGLKNKVTVFETRSLSETFDVESAIEACSKDKSALVRKVALAGIIHHKLRNNFAMEIAKKLQNDRSNAVREHAEYILKNTPISPPSSSHSPH